LYTVPIVTPILAGDAGDRDLGWNDGENGEWRKFLVELTVDAEVLSICVRNS
jgi:hypothetical protein